MEAARGEIRSIAKTLFAEDRIDLFIGYENGTVPLRSRPCFLSGEDQVERLTWDSFCSNNLAAFLQKYFENEPNRRKKREAPYPRIGVVAKGCDYRSVVALIKERQVVRENLVLIGMPCTGMIDHHKVASIVDGTEIIEAEESESGKLTVTTRNGKKHEFDREEVLQQACIECRFPSPEGTDFMVEGEARKAGDGGVARIAEFEKRDSAEKWDYFQTELAKCIRCNACRQACPTCWCKECFADHTDMKWIGVGNEASDAMIFQIIRIYHQAGRCVECDACYAACPMGVDLRTYTRKMVKDVEELFDYLPDFNVESTPPLATFDENDSNDFIVDPEKN